MCFEVGRLIYRNGPKSAQRIAITFDDGPDNNFTAEVLAILAKAGVKATFFLLGREMVKYPDLVKAILSGGHEIGHHSFDHFGENIREQIGICVREIAAYEVPDRLFRPPGGRIGFFDLLWLKKHGYKTVLWSFDTHDSMRHDGKWQGADPDYAAVKAGDIILMHDDNAVCVKELPVLIETVRKRGLEPVTVGQLLVF